MNELRLKPAPHWQDYGITVEWIEEESEWIHRDTGSPGAIDGFFDCAGRLMRFCALDYYLLGPMFFQAVIGLEAMLRVHFQMDGKTLFCELLKMAVEDDLVHDGIFSQIRPFHQLYQNHIDQTLTAHADRLASLLPALRNQYMHGTYQFHPDYLYLAIKVREMADVLTMPRTPEW